MVIEIEKLHIALVAIVLLAVSGLFVMLVVVNFNGGVGLEDVAEVIPPACLCPPPVVTGCPGPLVEVDAFVVDDTDTDTVEYIKQALTIKANQRR